MMNFYIKKTCKFQLLSFLFAVPLIFTQPIQANYLTNLNKAIKLHQKHKSYEAIPFYNEAFLELQKTNDYRNLSTSELSDLHFNRGLAYFQIGALQEAYFDLDKAVKFDGTNDPALFNRGLVRAELGDLPGALKDLNRTIELVPGDAKAFFNRAIVNHELGNKQAAIQDAQTAERYFAQLKQRRKVREIQNLLKIWKSS
ncbi:MAG TPA: tetratricopeptide repeat protein [Vampirovibrionales bacterium]